MDEAPSKLAARPDSQAVAKRPQIVAGAVAARLGKVMPLPKDEPGSDFDRAMREKLALFEHGQR